MQRSTIASEAANVKFDSNGLVPVIAQDHQNGEVLMMAWMNEESLKRTLSSGRMTYWSRSRQCYWEKGATSGHHQSLVSLSIDCDRDCLLAQVDQVGAACHLGKRSCFFTDIESG